MCKRIGILATAVFGLAACAPMQQYRTVYPDVCVSATPEPSKQCESHALQQLPTPDGNRYLLGFVEFDDQGRLWDRKQMADVVGRLEGDAAARDLLTVVFVHGWEHSAAPGDDNVEAFRRLLAQLADSEAEIGRVTGARPREVAGVYLGWRGSSVTLPLLKSLALWGRKNTAQDIGRDGAVEVLSRLRRIAQAQGGSKPGHRDARLVLVGYSLGRTVITTALAHMDEGRFVESVDPAGIPSDVAGFADLVVLINPAAEAGQRSTLANRTAARGSYRASQRPVVLELTPETDAASGNSTDQPTHRLYPSDTQARAPFKQLSTADSVRLFVQSSADWSQDRPGSRISFGDLMLERTPTSAGHNPYLLTYVDKLLLADHKGLDDPRILEFVKQLILISTQSPERSEAIRRLRTSAPVH